MSVEQHLAEARRFFDQFEEATPILTNGQRKLRIGALAAATEQGQAVLRVAAERGIEVILAT